ncbi:MAG: hypothetical protein JSR62_14535 [Nitrospira sp.]|nr:hypothetical protein [Nitrospira sp.]
MTRILAMLLGLTLSVQLSALAEADDSAPVSPAALVAEATVSSYLLNARGQVTGLLLADGVQVHITLRASADTLTHVKTGDRIRIYGLRREEIPLILPDHIENLTTGASYDVPSRNELPFPRSSRGLTEMVVAGRIETLLYDYVTGRVHGMRLSDGSQVWLPADVNDAFRASLKLQEVVRVKGHGVTTPHGRALEALAIGHSAQSLTYLDASVQRIAD